MEEHDTMVVKLESKAEELIEKRISKKIPLMSEQDQLRTRLTTVEAQIEENQVAKEKLLALVADCKEMKLLPAASKCTALVQKNLKKMLKEVEEEAKLVNQCPNHTIPPVVSQVPEVQSKLK